MSQMKLTMNFGEGSVIPQAESMTEAHAIYASLEIEKIAPVVVMLAEELKKDSADIVKAAQDDPDMWWAPYHFIWGMQIRNLLREKGYGEDYFGIANLDDIYVQLVEDALGIHKEHHEAGREAGHFYEGGK